MMPRFSIIVPCFNAAATLAETLEAVRAQTFDDWEAICMEDGSRDATPSVLADASRRDERIRVFRQKNAGPAITRNRAVGLARGELLAFLDADDFWSPERLARLDMAFGGADAPDALYTRVGFFKSDPARVGATSRVIERPLEVSDLVGENPVCTMSNIALTAEAWRRSGGIDPALIHAEDLEWLIRLVASGARIIGLPETLTFYRANENGLSANLEAMHQGWATAAATARRIDPTLTDRDIARGEAIHLRYLARRALRTGQPPHVSRSLALRGLRRSPAGFLDQPRRGLSILAAALASTAIPPRLRTQLFQD